MFLHDDMHSDRAVRVSTLIEAWRWNKLCDAVEKMRKQPAPERGNTPPFQIQFRANEKDAAEQVTGLLAELWDIGTVLTYVHVDKAKRTLQFAPEVMTDLLKIREEALRLFMHNGLLRMKTFTDRPDVKAGATGVLLRECCSDYRAENEFNEIVRKLEKELILYANDVHRTPEEPATSIEPLIGYRRTPKSPHLPWTFVQASDTISHYRTYRVQLDPDDPKQELATALESCAAQMEAYDELVKEMRPVARALEAGRGRRKG